MTQQGSPSMDPFAYLIHEALEQIGWRKDPNALAERVKRLDLGLPAEDEFSMLISWMGKCKVVHKLDELQAPPSSKLHYRVPDLLAIFEHKGKSIPCLIEVKTSKEFKLSWRPDYYEGLQNYAHDLNLPILLAWKFTELGSWALCDLSHFTRPNINYKIELGTALKNTLMGLLAGDFALVLKSGVGLHLTFTKESKTEDFTEGQVRREEWLATITEAYGTDGAGNRVSSFGRLWPVFLTNELEETDSIDESHVRKSYVVPQDERVQWAHAVLPALLRSNSKNDAAIRWREVLTKHDIPLEFSALREAVVEGIPKNLVRYVFDQMPAVKPTYL